MELVIFLAEPRKTEYVWFQFLNVFSYCRTVHVSKEERQTTIHIRKFWFFTTAKIIPFEKIEYVDRTHWDVPESVGLDADGLCANDVTEVWYVRIFTKDSALPVSLFRFYGEGSRLTGWFGVIFGGDSMIDAEGYQDVKSDRYAKLVAEYTGAKYVG